MFFYIIIKGVILFSDELQVRVPDTVVLLLVTFSLKFSREKLKREKMENRKWKGGKRAKRQTKLCYLFVDIYSRDTH